MTITEQPNYRPVPRYQRSGVIANASPMSNPSDGFLSAIGGGRPTAGVDVTPRTMLSLSQVFACVRNLSEDVAKLPCGVYRKTEKGREAVPEHPADVLLSLEANSEMTAFAARQAVIACALLWGGGYAEIERNGAGAAIGLWPIGSWRVKPKRVGGRLAFEVDGSLTLRAEDVLYIPGFTLNGVVGEIVTTYAGESAGLALASQMFAAAFFGNSTVPGLGVEMPNKITKEQETAFRSAKESLGKGAANAFRMFIVDGGAKISKLSWNAQESQILETRQFAVEDICRWFRIPPHKVGHLLRAQGWSTLEATNTDYVTDSLMPWLVKFEQEGGRKLFGPAERRQGYYIRHSVQGLMRGDSAARAAFYNTMQQNGDFSINDVRELEDMNPIEGGDTHFIQLNMQSLEAAKAPKQAPKEPADPQKQSENDPMQRAFDRLMADAKARLQRVEADKLSRKGRNVAEIEAFYAGHVEYVRAATLPIAEATGITTFDPAAYCAAQCSAAIAALEGN